VGVSLACETLTQVAKMRSKYIARCCIIEYMMSNSLYMQVV